MQPQLTNGDQVQHPPKRPEYTGEILLRTRPKTYRKVIDLLSQGRSTLSIAQECKVSRMTVDAIEVRKSADISQRKNELALLVSDIAHIGGARVADKIGKAGVRDAIIGTGVAIDKLIALTTQNAGIQVAIVNLPTASEAQERALSHDKLDEITRLLKARQAGT